MKLHLSSSADQGGLGTNCSKVVDAMRSLGIAGHVTKNHTVVCDDRKGECTVEQGCAIQFASRHQQSRESMRNIWTHLVQDLPIECGFIQTERFSGCIYDFLKRTDCPHNLRK